MNTYISKTQTTGATLGTRSQSQPAAISHIEDNRPESLQMKALQELANASSQVAGMKTVQTMAHQYAAPQLPVQEKSEPPLSPEGKLIRATQEISQSPLAPKIVYNSPEPEKINAHAFTQGDTIHVGRGQEKHLPHELGHVVQQAIPDYVRPTMQFNGVNINDNLALESEADTLGERIVEMSRKF